MANIIVNFDFPRIFSLKIHDLLTLSRILVLVYKIQYYKLSSTGKDSKTH